MECDFLFCLGSDRISIIMSDSALGKRVAPKPRVQCSKQQSSMWLGAGMSSSSSSSSSLLLLLCLLLAKQGAVLGDQTWWHAASISYAEPNNTVGQFAESEPVPFLACSSSANSAPWAELFCHVGERCLLSDNVVQGRYHDPSATVGETQCWTKHG